MRSQQSTQARATTDFGNVGNLEGNQRQSAVM